jgi:hypothetical protein
MRNTWLSAYISAEFIGKRGAELVAHEVSQIVIEDETQSDDDDSFLTDDKNWHLAWSWLVRQIRKEAPALQRKTLDSFRQATNGTELRREFHLSVKCQLVHPMDVWAIFKKGGWWNDFYSKYPETFCSHRMRGLHRTAQLA